MGGIAAHTLQEAALKLLAILAALAGLALGIIIIAHFGFAAVYHALIAIGWPGFLLVCGLHLLLFVPMGLAWHAIQPKPPRSPAFAFIWGRLLRDSAAEVLPLSPIGGYVFGARGAILAGILPSLAYASTVVDVTLELLSQVAYAALGLFLLSQLEPQTALVRPILAGLLVALAILAAFIVAQQRGVETVERLVRRLAAHFLPATVADAAPVQKAIHRIYGRPGPLLQSFLLHSACWIGSGIEIWLALHIMHVPIGPGGVLAIESLLYGIRSAAFVVPNAIGVQEGAYVMLFGLFGLPPESALAISLLKRGRDVLIGVPVLAVWQAIESRRLWRRGSVPRSDPAEDSKAQIFETGDS